jgi:hypothetical protein
MLTIEQLRWLASPEGAAERRAAAVGAALPQKLLLSLRRRLSPWQAAAVAEIIDLQQRAAPRFAQADGMLFTRQGLEQASGVGTAEWRAAQMPRDALVYDLCCGIGGDAMALARRGPVVAIDRDPAAAVCAAHHLALSASGRTTPVAVADVGCLRGSPDAFVLDPARRRDGLRLRDPEEWSPPLSFVHELTERWPSGAVKVSPAIRDDVLEVLGGRVEFVSEGRECKEAAVWFGAVGPEALRSAVVLPAGVRLSRDLGLGPADVTDLQAWLMEPDPAVIRAGLLPELCALVSGALIDQEIAYVTVEAPVATPFGRWHRVLGHSTLRPKKIAQELARLGLHAVAVKRRGAPVEPEQLMRDLPRTGGRPAVVVATRLQGRLIAIICGEGEQEPGASAA